MSAEACCRLQWLCASSLALPTHDGATRVLMGNAMSLSVVEPLLRSALISAGLLTAAAPNRWSIVSAQLAIVHDAWGSDIPELVFTKRFRLVFNEYDSLTFPGHRFERVRNCEAVAADHQASIGILDPLFEQLPRLNLDREANSIVTHS